MLKKGLVIGSATALALVVLLLTMLAEPSRRPDSDTEKLTPQKGITPVDADSLASIDPNQRAIRGAQGYKYSRVNKHNQLIQGGGDDLVPKPLGVSDVTHPWARIHMTPYRVLEIRAEHGTFVAPDRQPRNGEFQGRVVLTLFDEDPPERPVDLSENSKDIKLRIFLEDAKFDLELGQIESQGKVHVTTPRIDFRGKGLDLNYNEVRKRIEHLEIAQGDVLRIKPASEAAGTGKTQGGSGGATRPATRPGKRAATQPTAPPFYRARLTSQVRIQGPAMEAEADQLITIFAMNQHGGTDQTTTPKPTHAPATQPHTGAARHTAAQATQAAEPWLPPDEPMAPQGANDLIVTWVGPMLVEPEDHPPAELTDADDSMMELTGRPMRTTIFKKDPTPRADGAATVDENITSARFDYLSKSGRIRLTGSPEFPMVLDSVSLGGKLTGPRLVLDQLNNLGYVDGGGTLVSTAPGNPAPNAPGAPGDMKAETRSAGGGRMPAGMKITWYDRLDLTFYPRAANHAEKAASSAEPIRLRALETAIFHGKVTIDHPQFQMIADRVLLAMGDPAKGKQTLNSILANGHVRTASLEGPTDKRVTIHSDKLAIGLVRDASNSMQPSRLQAEDNVHAELPGKSLDSRLLDVILAVQESAKTRPATETVVPVQGSHVAIKTLTAQGDVHVHTDDPMTMTADRLVDDARSDEVELTGPHDQPAIVERTDGTLISHHMFLNQKAQTVRVDGPGLFAFPAKPAGTRGKHQNPETTETSATTAPAPPDISLLLKMAYRPTLETLTTPGISPDTAPATLPGAGATTTSDSLGNARRTDASLAGTEDVAPDHWSVVTWRDSMSFDNLQGIGQFRGVVRVHSRSGNQTNRLRCDDLRLEFTDKNPKSPATHGATTTVSNSVASATPFAQGSRALRNLDIRGNAHFEGETWQDEPGDNLLRRITLEGKEILFTEPAADLVVPGAGKMLIEDYRPDAPPPPERPEHAEHPDHPNTQPAQSQPASPIKFTGHGQTLLLWDGRLTINTTRNDLLAEDNVRMIHLPGGPEDKTQLFCGRLKTDLEQSGGSGSSGGGGSGSGGGLTMLGAGQSQPPLKSIQADQNVHVLARGRTIVSDHLRYNATTQTIALTCDPDHLVEMTSPEDTNTLTAVEFDWNLAKDRIEVVRPGPGRMPTK